MERHILTVDVEDNFTFDELVDKKDWNKYEGQVVENTLRILTILKKYNAKATFFIVGTVAERHPEIVKYIIEDRHEVASHSYWHKPLKYLLINEIEKDIKMSQDILSSIVGEKVLGYRAMGFSTPENEITFYKILKTHGFLYDSSKKLNQDYKTIRQEIIYEIYPSVLNFFNKKIIFSGGSYFRLLPMFLIKNGFKQYRKINQPVMFYLHPWEFNKDQPKRKVKLTQKIVQSSFTFTTERKIVQLLNEHKFVSIREYIGV